MKFTRLIFIVSALNLAGLIALCIAQFSGEGVIYVNNGKLYDNFTLTTTYKSQMEQFKGSRQVLLDSMEMNIRAIESQLLLDSTNQLLHRNYQLVRQNYLSNLDSFETEGEKLANEYDRKIWEKLNELIAEYGNDHEVEIILGANANGVLLHANPDLDATDDVIQYINSKIQE